jgi:hypothetical protein
MDGTANHHVKQNKPDLERQILHVLSQMQNLDFFFKDMKIEGGIIWEEEGQEVNTIKVHYMCECT